MADMLKGLSEITFLGHSIVYDEAPKTSPKHVKNRKKFKEKNIIKGKE